MRSLRIKYAKKGGVYNNLKNVVIYIYIIKGAKIRKREKDGTKMN